MCDETEDLDEETIARIEAHKAYRQEQNDQEYSIKWADDQLIGYSLKGLESIELGD